MAKVRALTKRVYKIMSRFYQWHFAFLVVFAVALGVSVWYYLNINIYKWLEIVIYILAAALLYLVVSGLTIWKWFFGTFRYPSYWIAKVLASIRQILHSKYLKITLAIALATIIWGFKEDHFGDGFIIKSFENFFRKFFEFSSLLFTVLLTMLLLILWKMFRLRKRIVISDFLNYTGDDKLEKMVNGISARILNELNRLTILFNTIDEIHPNIESKTITGALDVENLRKELGEIISPSSTIEIWKVKIPIKLLYLFFRKAFHGPLLTGSIHIKGDKLIMSACLKGGNYTGSWEIDIKDIQESYKTDSHLLVLMTDQLIHRIFAYIFRDISPRWETMEHYAQGLKYFRETIRTEENSKLNLIKAKNEFSLAIRKDNRFVQCLCNIGIIYLKLKNQRAAIAAFREAIAQKPDYCYCYYQLASIFYKSKDYNNALWFCEQAINICPTNSLYWNLLGVIKYYQWEAKDRAAIEPKKTNPGELKKHFFIPKEIPNHLTYPIKIGAFLAWRSLSKSIAVGEKVEQEKETAMMNVRNLAVLYGKMHKITAGWLFNQALMLSPDENELYFEVGRYYFKRKKWKRANEAFRRVYEDDRDLHEPISFWAMYIYTNAKLLTNLCEKKDKKSNDPPGSHDSNSCGKCNYHDKEKCNKYKRVLKNGYRLFLGAVARLINKKLDEKSDKAQRKERFSFELPLYLDFVAKAFDLVPIEHEGYNTESLKNLLNIPDDNGGNNEKENRQNKASDSIRELPTNDKNESKKQNQNDLAPTSDHTEHIPIFGEWVKAQQTFIDTRKILNESKDKVALKDLREIEEPLRKAVKLFENKGMNELRILGLHRYLAEVRFRLKRYGEALNAARAATRYNPYDKDSRRVLGDIYLEMKDYHRGIEELEISFNLGNPSHEILNKIGDAYCKMAGLHFEKETRKQLLQKAVDTYNRSLILMMDKSYEECAGQEQETKENTPDPCFYTKTLMDIHYRLGATYFPLSQYDKASAHFKIAFNMAKILEHKKDALRIWYKMKKSINKAKALQYKKG